MNSAPLNRRRLAFKNLRRKLFRTTCLVVLVALFAFTLFGGLILNANLRGGLSGLSARLGADILLVPYGYEKDVQGALLRGEPSSFYMKAEVAAKARSHAGVAAATPQLFMASLNAGCCTAKVQIIGYDPATDFIIKPWINHKFDGNLQPHQVVAGARIIPGVGEEIQLFGRTYTLAAKLETTGMGFDTSIFMTMDAVHDLMRYNAMVSGDADDLKNYISSVAVKAKPGVEPKELANALMRAYASEYNLDMVVTKGMLTNIAGQLKNISAFIYVLAVMLWIFSVIVLFIVFASFLGERKYELSLLRLFGASRKWLAGLIMLEALLMSLMGAVLGLLTAALVIFPFSTLIFNAFGLPYLQLSGGQLAGYAVLTLILAGLTGPLGSLYAALSITRFDAYSTMREGE